MEIAKGSGLLKEKPCEVCGTVHAIHAHHEDYSKPLDVKWLCAKHHGELHGQGINRCLVISLHNTFFSISA